MALRHLSPLATFGAAGPGRVNALFLPAPLPVPLPVPPCRWGSAPVGRFHCSSFPAWVSGGGGVWAGWGERRGQQRHLCPGVVLPALTLARPHPASSPPAAGLVQSAPAAADRSTPATGCGERGATPTTSPASPVSPASGSSPPARSSVWWRRRCCAGFTTTP